MNFIRVIITYESHMIFFFRVDFDVVGWMDILSTLYALIYSYPWLLLLFGATPITFIQFIHSGKLIFYSFISFVSLFLYYRFALSGINSYFEVCLCIKKNVAFFERFWFLTYILCSWKVGTTIKTKIAENCMLLQFSTFMIVTNDFIVIHKNVKSIEQRHLTKWKKRCNFLYITEKIFFLEPAQKGRHNLTQEKPQYFQMFLNICRRRKGFNREFI